MKIGFGILLILAVLFGAVACDILGKSNDSYGDGSVAGDRYIVVVDWDDVAAKMPPFKRLSREDLTVEEWTALGPAWYTKYPLFLSVADDEDFHRLLAKIDYPREKVIIEQPTEVKVIDDGQAVVHGRLLRGKIVIKYDKNREWITINDYPVYIESYAPWLAQAEDFKASMMDMLAEYDYRKRNADEYYQRILALREEVRRLQRYVDGHRSINDERLIETVQSELAKFDAAVQVQRNSFACVQIVAAQEGLEPNERSTEYLDSLISANKTRIKYGMKGGDEKKIIKRGIQDFTWVDPAMDGAKVVTADCAYVTAMLPYPGEDNGVVARVNVYPQALWSVTETGMVYSFTHERLQPMIYGDSLWVEADSIEDINTINNFPSDAQIDAIVKADIDLREKYYRLYRLFLPLAHYEEIALLSKFLIEERGGLQH